MIQTNLLHPLKSWVVKSIIPITLASGEGVAYSSVWTMAEINANIRSDHWMIEVVQREKPSNGTSHIFIRWNIKWRQEDALQQAKQRWVHWFGKPEILLDKSTFQQLEDEATEIRRALTEVLNRKAKRTKVSVRWEQWWNQNIVDKRKVLGPEEKA
jgi:hypothetical protein